MVFALCVFLKTICCRLQKSSLEYNGRTVSVLTYRWMHDLQWIAILGSRERRFANNFHERRSHEWKSLANRITSGRKIVIHGVNVLFYFLHTIPLKQWSIADFAIVAKGGLFWLCIVMLSQLICDAARTLSDVIVTSYTSIILARANWCKGDFHSWITAVNIDFSPPDIHGLACNKLYSYIYKYISSFLLYQILRIKSFNSISTVLLPHVSKRYTPCIIT